MTAVWVCFVKSSYFSEYLKELYHVYDSFEKASQWEKDYKEKIKANYGLVVTAPKSGDNASLDKFLEKKKKVEMANKFLGTEIIEMLVE